jgi:hypothetical protein
VVFNICGGLSVSAIAEPLHRNYTIITSLVYVNICWPVISYFWLFIVVLLESYKVFILKSVYLTDQNSPVKVDCSFNRSLLLTLVHAMEFLLTAG